MSSLLIAGSKPTPYQVLAATLPTRREQQAYERELVRYWTDRGFGIKAIALTGFPGGKEAIRGYLKNGVGV